MKAVDELLQLEQGEPLLTVLSYGIGQDSTAMLARLIEEPAIRRQVAPGRLIVVFCDTKDEHRHTYEFLDHTRRMCAKIGAPFFWLSADRRFHSDAWSGLIEQWQRNSTVGLKSGRKSCTDNLKIKPFYRFLSLYVQQEFDIYTEGSKALVRFAQYYGRIRVLIGFASDESTRILADSKREPWHRAAIELKYPLIEWGWAREDCVNYLKAHGYQVPFPSNCRRCPYSTDLDVLWLSRNDPKAFAEWVELERKKLERFAYLGERNHGVFGKRTLAEVLTAAEQKYAHLSGEELTALKFMRGHCVRSKY